MKNETIIALLFAAVVSLAVLPQLARSQTYTFAGDQPSQTFTLKPGDSVSINNYIYELADVTDQAVAFKISKNGQVLNSFQTIAKGSTSTLYGADFTYVSVSGKTAIVRVEVQPPKTTTQQAVQAFEQLYPKYPASSITVSDGDCPNGGDCIIVQGHRIETNQPATVNVEGTQVNIQSYHFIDAGILFIDKNSGLVVENYRTT
ncbi:MAG TPA: hypothetical protein VGQ00_03835 [Candidatus Norongarragalinales archaeon]|jgi:hypothetical protein|nr:hypothetical protein [Candidatus Norongarragalinales archaeon]